MSVLRLYTVFHLNLAYSSIEEETRSEVVERCYRPLLRLAREYGLPLGIEASAYTLESAAACDPAWLEELRDLTARGSCEFVGSGYAQVIGPLVPREVNAANLRLGNMAYQRLLGFVPDVALVNEQAYSAGLAGHYLDAGYRAVVMEWDNPARFHPEWDPAWRYFPQRARGPQGEEIGLIWSHSIAFQKFQRYVHGEMELEEYLAYLAGHIGDETRAFPLYTNDIEVFGFRPGRYHTEAPLEGSEWQRIARLVEILLGDGRFEFAAPRGVLDTAGPQAGHLLALEAPPQPVPVKKQGKYNITRWAVTGRDDLGINTACWRIYRSLAADPAAGDDDWRELCYLWSSDFRTHITAKRWQAYRDRLAAFGTRWNRPLREASRPAGGPAPRVERDGRWLTIETASVRLRLNCRRGLAIDGLWLESLGGPPLCATLDHGYFDDIDLGADWYSGHLVLELPGRPKITDLGPVEPEVVFDQQGGVSVRAVVSTPLGPLVKSLSVAAGEAAVGLTFRPQWPKVPVGSLRMGNFTFNPDTFERPSLFYAAASGGGRETHYLDGTTVGHGDAVSFLVSARHGLGVTDGRVLVGDGRRVLALDVDKTAAALIGLISYRESAGTYFFRLAFSAGEMDETCRPDGRNLQGLEFRFKLHLLGDPVARGAKTSD